MMNSRITSHSVLSPNGSMSITLVAIPAGMPAVPRCRPTVFYKPRREKAPKGLVYVLSLLDIPALILHLFKFHFIKMEVMKLEQLEDGILQALMMI